MNWIEAIVLGVVQGLTEFLPVSSSGHLVLFQHLFGLSKPEVLFDIFVHVGTLVAVLVVFRRELTALLVTLWRLPGLVKEYNGFKPLFDSHAEIRMIVMIIIGSIPTAILGLLFAQIAERLFGTLWLVGITLTITGTFLWFTRKLTDKGRSITRMGLHHALIIGFVQGLAIVPGISRSGATIAAALYLGIDRQLAGRYSFLLSIAPILGALLLGLDGKAFQTALPMGLIIAGTLSAALIGWLALVVLLRMVHKGQFYRFAPYCWAIGGITLIVSII